LCGLGHSMPTATDIRRVHAGASRHRWHDGGVADNGSEADFSTGSDADPAADSATTDGAATGERSVTTDGGKLRFRRSSAITVAAVIMLIAGLSIATWQPYL